LRLPHENYIRFLITTGLGIDEVNEELKEIGLPTCPVDGMGNSTYFDEQYQLLQDSQIPKQIKKYWAKEDKHKIPQDFFSYMNVVGLKEAWLYNIGKNDAFLNALDALKDPDINLATKTLLATKIQPIEVSALINGRFAYVFPETAVALYAKYFFNVSIMSRESWAEYLKLVDGSERMVLYKALSGREKEVRADLELPNKISVAEHYQQIHVMAMEKFSMYRRNATPETDQLALKWASLAMASGDKYEKLKLGDASDFTKDIQLEFETVNTAFPMVGQETVDEVRDQKNAAKRENLDKINEEKDKKAKQKEGVNSAQQQTMLDS